MTGYSRGYAGEVVDHVAVRRLGHVADAGVVREQQDRRPRPRLPA